MIPMDSEVGTNLGSQNWSLVLREILQIISQLRLMNEQY